MFYRTDSLFIEYLLQRDEKRFQETSSCKVPERVHGRLSMLERTELYPVSRSHKVLKVIRAAMREIIQKYMPVKTEWRLQTRSRDEKTVAKYQIWKYILEFEGRYLLDEISHLIWIGLISRLDGHQRYLEGGGNMVESPLNEYEVRREVHQLPRNPQWDWLDLANAKAVHFVVGPRMTGGALVNAHMDVALQKAGRAVIACSRIATQVLGFIGLSAIWDPVGSCPALPRVMSVDGNTVYFDDNEMGKFFSGHSGSGAQTRQGGMNGWPTR